MIKFTGVLLWGFIGLSVGCGNKEAVKVAADVATRVCACNDLPCTEAPAADLLELQKTKPQGTDADKKQIQASVERMNECIEKLRLSAAAGGSVK